MNYSKVKKAVECHGFDFFENDSKPFNLNIVGFRDSTSVNTFNDLLSVSWKFKGIENCIFFRITTDPGTFYLNNPLNVDGTAIVALGQQKGVWKLGKHQGKYDALVQRKEINVLRDNDKNGILDLNALIQSGFFGINCHRATEDGSSNIVGKWSAGCQVFQDSYDFDLFISIIKQAIPLWGNSFSYTLLSKSEIL